jgi:triosephosphate isomerase
MEGTMAARRPVAAGNWKMNTTVAEGVALCRDLVAGLNSIGDAEVVVCPPFTHLARVAEALAGSPIKLGAQDIFWEPKGAFTGEVSAEMVRELAGYVIIGHSERRQFFGETDDTVRLKLVAALRTGLIPIVCVGESLDERDAGLVEEVLARQVRGALDAVEFDERVIFAYEPVWAIGTGRAANGQQANAAMGFIRGIVAERSSRSTADGVRILYGGSVNAQNVAEFMAQEHIDGGLVGGASLQAASFLEIARQITATRVT